MFFCGLNQFDERKYVVRDGIVVRRVAYELEVRGMEPSEYDANIDDMFEKAKQKKAEKNERKRQREIQAERVRAAKRRKTCPETCALYRDEVRQSKGNQGIKTANLVKEAKKHCIPYSGTKAVVAQRLLKHYQDFHGVTDSN